MGADIKNLRTRIKSVDSTLHLTKAMGLVASSKIRRATEAMNKSKDYLKAYRDVVDALTSCEELKRSPYLEKREEERLCLIVVAGDRGLAGGYNANIFRLQKEYEAHRIYAIGKRACEKYSKDLTLAESFSYEEAYALSKKLCEGFLNKEFDKVAIICTKYISIMSQEAQIKWLLPLSRGEKGAKSILFEPDEATILNSVIYEYIASSIFAAVRESYASEVAARRFAMDSAGKNAAEMLDGLHLKYNRARQGAITQEITEIVAGTEQ